MIGGADSPLRKREVSKGHDTSAVFGARIFQGGGAKRRGSSVLPAGYAVESGVLAGDGLWEGHDRVWKGAVAVFVHGPGKVVADCTTGGCTRTGSFSRAL